MGGQLRLRSLVVGVTPDGWTGASATYTRYVAPGAHYVLVRLARTGLRGLPDAHVQAAVGPSGSTRVWERRMITVPGGGSVRLRLPVRRVPFQVVLGVSPTFTPSQFGSPDTRTLGVRASFSVER